MYSYYMKKWLTLHKHRLIFTSFFVLFFLCFYQMSMNHIQPQVIPSVDLDNLHFYQPYALKLLYLEFMRQYPHVWAILNAGIFSVIIYLIMMSVSNKRFLYFPLLISMFLILSSHMDLLQQGFSYSEHHPSIVAVGLNLLYLFIIKDYVFDGWDRWYSITTCIVSIIGIGIFDLQILLLLVLQTIAMMIYLTFVNQRRIKKMWIYLLCGIGMSVYAYWSTPYANLPFAPFATWFEKIVENAPYYMNWTLLNHRALMITTGSILLGFIYQKRKDFHLFQYDSYIMMAVVSYVILQSMGCFKSWIILDILVDCVFVAELFYVTFQFMDEHDTALACFSLISILTSTGLMLVNHQFDASCAIVSFFYWLIYTILMFDELRINQVMKWIFGITLVILCLIYGIKIL